MTKNLMIILGIIVTAAAAAAAVAFFLLNKTKLLDTDEFDIEDDLGEDI